MKKFHLFLLIVVVLWGGQAAWADGDFYVVAVGGGVGTKITSVPYEIKTSGFYYLGCNLTCPTGNGITVTVDDVTIDLMGFCLSGHLATDGFNGIWLNGHKNVEVRNGTLTAWGVGVSEGSIDSSGHRVINIRAKANDYGIALKGSGHLVKGCTALDNTGRGISLSGMGCNTVSGNVTSNCGYGIELLAGGSVIGNTVTCNAGQTGISLSTSTGDPIIMDQNTVSGDGTHYSGGSTAATVWAGKSTDNPWGSNAGHP
jgi:parallel beta-helix repeat protein